MKAPNMLLRWAMILPAADEAKAEEKKDRAERVEDRVECGEKGELGSGDVGGRMVVDQPGEEERGDHADSDDQQDDRRVGYEAS